MSTATGVVHLDPSTVALEYPPTPTRYLRIQIPEQKNLPVLVRLYFQAWEEQSPELLERIFAFNAEYYEKPHEPPVRGIKQIQRYWAENVLQQRDIHTEILSVAYSRDLAFAEWHARFIKSNERVCLSGTMIFELDVQSLLVSSFREYFRSAKEQVDVQDRLAYSGSTD
jgi:hypothetical protein